MLVQLIYGLLKANRDPTMMTPAQEKISLVIMIVASIILAYFFTMTIILRRNFTNHANKLYQSLLMGAWMGIIMILPMIFFAKGHHREMMIKTYFPVLVILVVLVALFSWMIRQQIGIDDKQYILGMIEHHQMAIDMSDLLIPKTKNRRLKQLAEEIIADQEEEIDLMYSLLRPC